MYSFSILSINRYLVGILSTVYVDKSLFLSMIIYKAINGYSAN